MQRADSDNWKSTDVARLLALVETECRYYQRTLALLPVPVAVVDRTLALVSANAEWRTRFGVSAADLGQYSLGDFLPAADAAALLARLFDGQERRLSAEINLANSSSEHRLRLSVARSHDWQAGAADEAIVVLEDIGAAPAPPPAASLHEPMARLAGRVSHVANNLLMILSGYTEEIVATFDESDQRRQDMLEVASAAGRLANLTRQLTLLAKPPAYPPEEFDLAAWAAAWRPPPGSPRLTALSGGAPIPATANRELLAAMLSELWRAVGVHAGAAATAALTLTDGDRPRLQITFAGIDLPVEECSQLLEPFYGPRVKGVDPPLGIAGLLAPLARLGGAVELAGMPSGEIVATFSFNAAGAGFAPAPPPPPPRPVILLLEDESGIRTLLQRTLERQGYEVLAAATPSEAIDQAQAATRLDLLLTDLQLPEMHGSELAAAVLAVWPGCKLLCMSGFAGEEDAAAQAAQGQLPPDAAFLQKPFTLSAMLEAVAAQIEPFARGAGA